VALERQGGMPAQDRHGVGGRVRRQLQVQQPLRKTQTHTSMSECVTHIESDPPGRGASPRGQSVTPSVTLVLL